VEVCTREHRRDCVPLSRAAGWWQRSESHVSAAQPLSIAAAQCRWLNKTSQRSSEVLRINVVQGFPKKGFYIMLC